MFIRCELPAVLLLLLSTEAIGQSDINDPQGSSDRAEESNAAAHVEVQKLDFHFIDDRDAKLTLRESPVFRATNPLRGEVYSNWFIWTHDGRPEVVASVSKWYSPRPYVGCAMTSLSTKRVSGRREALEIWRPHRVGVELKPILDADSPLDTAPQRLLQMRNLVREFTAEFKRLATIPEGGKLRLLSQPFFRYPETSGDLKDGAIFAFVTGTAPQLLLLIEARQTATEVRWEYALAPANSTEFHVWHKDREVWSLPQVAPPWRNSQNPTNTYTVFPDLTDQGKTKMLADRLSKALAEKPVLDQ